MSRHRIPPGPDQESVWDYPRPPRIEAFDGTLQIYALGELIAQTRKAFRILETSHPPSYYVPPEDIRMEWMLAHARPDSFCEWKGAAHYYDLNVGDNRIEKLAWAYAKPSPAYPELKNHLAFYAHKTDKCLINGEVVTPQPGNFYGGWITSNIVGPFKGGPDSWGW